MADEVVFQTLMEINPELGEDILEAVERRVPRDTECLQEIEGQERKPEGLRCSAGGRQWSLG